MIERQQIEWREVGDGLPDEGELVLVYCGSLDDVVFGYLGSVPVGDDDAREDGRAWFGEADGEVILEPICWAHIPYPEQLRRPA
ncbi:MAG: hypothetical protein RBS34_02655 [Desulfofustis sp.]|jgi:hypothetical protein|nr:hypothetical protein [Desulfofustis sp.]